jgi:serine/threonine protein phosphatase PrpC
MLRVAESFAKTDTGRQRRANEDNLFQRAPLFAVADGMGGARAGEVASKIVVETLEQGMPEGGSPEDGLEALAQEANHRIHELASSDERRAGMGTTLTAAYVGDGVVSFAHVGDSRAYRLREDQLEMLTDDHSLVGEMVRRGKLTEREAEEHPQRSVITRALGPEGQVSIDHFSCPARGGDVFLLCSDGLTSMVEHETVERIVRGAKSLKDAAQRLIREANERGGRDNITVVLFRLEDVGDAAGEEQPTQAGADAPTSNEVRDALAAAEAAPAAEAPPAPRRTAPLPRRPEAPPPKRRRRRWRPARLSGVLAVLAILAIVGIGAWMASRAVYFVGTDDKGFVTVYRGVPWELPGGLNLYERFYVSGVSSQELQRERRNTILDHRLRSRDDAADLVRKLELRRGVE